MSASVPPPAAPACLPEYEARAVALVRACEQAPGLPVAGADADANANAEAEAAATAPVPAALWSPEDGAWATRLTNETLGASAPPQRWLAERARHALQRLLPRQRSLQAALRPGLGRPGLRVAAVAASAVLGALAEGLGSPGQVNLLAPPLLVLCAWNAAVLLLLAVQALAGRRPGRWRRWLAARAHTGTAWHRVDGAAGAAGPWPAFAADWSARALPLTLARAALLLHLAAAALAAGVVAGMYLRGLVLDYRAGWQSTFLAPGFVHGLLQAVLAPAAALTDVPLPSVDEVAAMQLAAGRPATAAAAPWIHLWAVTLALFVIGPRLVLAAGAAAVAWHRARCIELPLAQPYYQRLLAAGRRGALRVQVLPHGAPPAAAAVLALSRRLAAVCGDSVVVRSAPATPYGNEETPPPPEPGSTLRLVLVDLTATPEPEAQGRFLAALRAAAPDVPLALLADETAWQRRFAAWPERGEQRRAAWHALARGHDVPFLGLALEADNSEAARHALESLLNRVA